MVRSGARRVFWGRVDKDCVVALGGEGGERDVWGGLVAAILAGEGLEVIDGSWATARGACLLVRLRGFAINGVQVPVGHTFSGP